MHSDDIEFMKLAIEEARKCTGEDDRTDPKVGAVVVLDGKVVGAAHRGETGAGDHAEFGLLEKKLPDHLLRGATVYTTLEPCTKRNSPKIPCAERLIDRKVGRVVIGMLDPNPDICGKGFWMLRDANIPIDIFPFELMAEIEELNREFNRSYRPRRSQPSEPIAPVLSAKASQSPADNRESDPLLIGEERQELSVEEFIETMEKGDLDKGQALYEQLQSRMQASPQKTHLKILYLDYRYRHTQGEADRSELISISDDQHVGHFASSKLAVLCSLANDLEGASHYYGKAAASADMVDTRIKWLIAQTQVLRKMGRLEDSIEILSSMFKEALSVESKAKILVALAGLYGDAYDKRIQVALLARAAQLLPGDQGTRFAAAFTLSEAGVSELALSLYGNLTRLPCDSAVYNNLGYQCKELGMPIRSIDWYKKSAAEGNSMAKANLAMAYMAAGFADDATKILDEARNAPNPHENIAHATIALSNRKRDETAKWKTHTDTGTREQTFLSNFADGVLELDVPCERSFDGIWEDSEGNELSLVRANSMCVGEFGPEYGRQSVSIGIFGSSGLIRYEYLGQYHIGLDRYRYGLAIINAEGNAFSVLWLNEKKAVFSSWKRRIPKMLASKPSL